MRNEDIVREDLEGDEAWHHVTSEPHLLAVESSRFAAGNPPGWQVDVAVMEFVRKGDPPYADLERAIEGAVADVVGVISFHREDNEVWWVTGSPSGEDLTRAVARALDDRVDTLRAFYDGLWDDSEST